ncbi:MAG: SUMF1/EgtB/PvdO family nonheme iron enzyme, partial [Anaerolineae bacterium]|nr:SUMF1/EgtB/PvdO family nonheme iron enzyme [Anaerolineae bacterium]
KDLEQEDGIEREARPHPQTFSEILNAFPGHLAIVGDAGSGKTTLLHVLISALAAQDPAQIAPDLVNALPTPLPLPIFLPLRFFEKACCEQGSRRYTHCAPDLLRFIDDWFAQWHKSDLPAGFLAAQLRAGRAWLLLDALDEIVDPVHRETVRNVIQDLAAQIEGTRMIVTARLTAYHNTQLNDRFTVVTVRDLNDNQRTRMVRALYNSLALTEAKRRAEELAWRFQASESLQTLARTPVMVWTAAVIHALRGELPEGRAALYDAYVEILLKQSFKRNRYDTSTVDALAEGEGWPLADRRHYLTYAAFKVHRLLESYPERKGAPRLLIGEDELADEILAPYFRENLGLSLRQARDHARAFLALMVERSGLLYESEQGYTIGDHLTMQEFLAACYVAENYAAEDPEGYTAFIREAVGRSWWREILLLVAGYLAEKPGFQAAKFLRLLAAQGETPSEQLAALALSGQGLLQLRAKMRRPTWYAGTAQELTQQLYTRLYAAPTEAPIPTRQEAGLALSRLYDTSGEDGLSDPRFTGPLGLPAFVRIPAGTFWMGEDDSEDSDESPRHKVTLEAYEIARYPTTNAMFARFIAAGGYQDRRWWEEALAVESWEAGKVKDWVDEWYALPRYGDNTRLNNPAQPVVGINWYEAVAYCCWLTAAANDGMIYRLPTEAEWERAARGSKGTRYPWGNTWAEGYCNSKETALETTSPVGLFPWGAAEGGIEDMGGNIWEWCWDWYDEGYYAHTEDAYAPTGPEKGGYRVLHGGSWYDEGESACRCSYRGWYIPQSWLAVGGFRCVRVPQK